MVHVHAHNNLQDASLAVLAHRINQKQEIINGYTRNALRVALDQGDLLCQAKQRVGNRKWKQWRQENCLKLHRRTDVLHRRLAAHRDRIEQELGANPDLTVREAIALISTPKAPKPTPSEKIAVIDQKAAVGGNTSSTVPTETTTAVPVSIKIAPPPAAPMTDANRTTVIGLAQQALSIEAPS
jgi:hypothetical protein